jgi:hypothetical protein
LVFCGVDAGGVVGAGVEEDDGAFGGGFEGGEHAVEVEAFGAGGPVGVVDGVDADITEDLFVVGPGWGREVEVGEGFEEFGEEEAAQVDCAGAGDGLEGADLVVFVSLVHARGL